MSKSRPKNDQQISLFRLISRASPKKLTEGSFRCIDELRVAMRFARKNCPLSVHQIAGEISHLVGESVTAEMIYSWTRGSDEQNGRPARHIPAEWLPAFCKVTGEYEPMAVLTRRAGLFLMHGTDAIRADIHRLDERAKSAQARKKAQEKLLRELIEHLGEGI